MRSFDEWFDENCDGSDLAKDACRKLWDEFSDQINISCRKSYEKQQSKIDELNCDINVQKEQLNKLDKVIDGYAIEVDELQNLVHAALIVAQSIRKEIEHGHLSDDEAKTLASYADELEQALKGGF